MTVCTTLANGVRIFSRPLPARRSAALGFWLRSGPRHEGAGQAGYAHLLEHLLFRGDGRYDRHYEALGGHVNARTMRELTAFHGLVSADRVRQLARLFTLLLLEPRLSAADLAAELPAVRHEQQLAADTGGEAQEAAVLRQVWGAHPLGRPITGGTASLPAVSPSALHAYYSERLTGASLWVVAAGAVDHDGLVEACRALERLPAGARTPQPAPVFTPCARHMPSEGAYVELLWVMPAPPPADPAHSAFVLAEQIVAGAPLSARLQRELRDRRGLVYAVDSRIELYRDSGLWWLRLQCDAGHARSCRAAVEAVMQDFSAFGPEREELLRALALLQARWQLEEDDPECVMERIAHEIAWLDRVTALNERLAHMTEVTIDDVRRALATAWRQRATFAGGPGAEDGSASYKENVGPHLAQANLRTTRGAST